MLKLLEDECYKCKNSKLHVLDVGWTDCRLLSMVDLESEGAEFLSESKCLFFKPHCGKCGGNCGNRR